MTLAAIEKQITCAEREINMRERVYPKWVEAGRMPKSRAEDEIATMKAIRDTLLGVHALMTTLEQAQKRAGVLL